MSHHIESTLLEIILTGKSTNAFWIRTKFFTEIDAVRQNFRHLEASIFRKCIRRRDSFNPKLLKLIILKHASHAL